GTLGLVSKSLETWILDELKSVIDMIPEVIEVGVKPYLYDIFYKVENIDAEGWNDDSQKNEDFVTEENDMIIEYHSGLTSKMIGSLITSGKSDKLSDGMRILTKVKMIYSIWEWILGKNKEKIKSIICDSNSNLEKEMNISDAENEYEIAASIDKMVQEKKKKNSPNVRFNRKEVELITKYKSGHNSLLFFDLSDRGNPTFEKLDRFLVNPEWDLLFHNAMCSHEDIVLEVKKFLKVGILMKKEKRREINILKQDINRLDIQNETGTLSKKDKEDKLEYEFQLKKLLSEEETKINKWHFEEIHKEHVLNYGLITLIPKVDIAMEIKKDFYFYLGVPIDHKTLKRNLKKNWVLTLINSNSPLHAFFKEITQGDSQFWRGLLDCKDTYRNNRKMEIGNGHSTIFAIV
ncbi:hypothetical protein ACJX0J_031411, partial [Zea mays]